MWYRIRRWFNAIAIDDPITYRLATILQLVMLTVLAGVLVTFPLTFITASSFIGQLMNITANLLALPCIAVAVFLLRRGQLGPSVVVFTAGFLVAAVIGFVPTGLRATSGYLVILTIPITLAGLLANRRGLWLVAGMSVVLVILLAAFERLTPHLVGFAPPSGDITINVIGIFTATVGVLVVCFRQFGTALRDALQAALTREAELDRLRASLETQVAERTAALETTVSQLQASQATIRELGAPILPVAPGVLVAPLVGMLDSSRITNLNTKLLEAVQQQRAQMVIFDITGVPFIDTQAAQSLLQIAAAVQLLGAQVAVVGIRAEVAQTMVTLGVDLGTISVFTNLQAALQARVAPAPVARVATGSQM